MYDEHKKNNNKKENKLSSRVLSFYPSLNTIYFSHRLLKYL